MDLAQRILDIAARHVPNTMRVAKSSHFNHDLKWDSLDRISFIMEVEDELSVSIPDNEIDALNTIDDVIEAVRRKKYIE